MAPGLVVRVPCVLFAALCGCQPTTPTLSPDELRGVLLVTATDSSNDVGRTREATLLCRDALRSAWPGLVDAFTNTVDGLPARCTATECSTPGWEFGAATRFLFDGRHLLTVARTSIGAGQAALDDEASWVDAALRQRRSLDCR